MKKIVVPEDMAKAAYSEQLPADTPTLDWDEADEHTRRYYRRILSAALRWLGENPQRPDAKQLGALRDEWNHAPSPTPNDYALYAIVWWQRRMFLAPDEEEIPEAIKQAICDGTIKADPPMTRSEYDYALLEAYRRGQKAGRNG